MKKLKIAIIGAGPAGSMSGYLLSKLGHEIHLFEQKGVLRRRVCGEYLCPMGVAVLDKHQLKEIVLPHFLPVQGMILVDEKIGDEILTTFPIVNKNSYGVSLNRLLFDQHLINLAIDQKVHVHYEHQLLNLNKKENGWQLIFANHRNEEFDFVIVADGRNSHVAKALGHSPEIDTSRVALHCYVPRLINHYRRYGQMHIFSDGSYCGINPINDLEVNLSIVIDKSEIQEKKNLIEIMNIRIKGSKTLSAMFRPIDEKVEIKTSAPLKHINHFIAGDRLAYVGDAAGFIDPLTGEGIANALLSADLLYEAMKSNPDLNTALAQYKHSQVSALKQKSSLNKFFQWLIKTPWAVSLIHWFLKDHQKRGDIFIGVIGNIYTPLQGLKKLITGT
jgi:flavin-dependent dehydrogenase